MLKMMMLYLLTMIINSKHTKSHMILMIILFNLSMQNLEIAKISYGLMGDLLSFWTTNLTLWILAIVSIIKMNNMQFYLKSLVAMLSVLTITFYNWNFMMFFLMFEISMIIMVLVIMSWGYQPERVEAILYMLMMTSMFSLPFFVVLMKNFMTLSFWFITKSVNLLDYISFMLIFMVKMPTYLIHIWLPKVHVESPVHGSMILAAIMLKLGCYGMIRMTKMMTKMSFKYYPLIIAFSLWSSLVLSISCNIQSDLKSLVAYSSIVHMMMTFIGINLMSMKSISSSMMIMIGHGMCSSLLFFTCNFMYKFSKSRSMVLNKGMMAVSPTMSTIWFFTCMSNAPMPPSLNIVGELLVFKVLMSWSFTTTPMIMIVMMFSSCFSIILFCMPTHGVISQNSAPMFINSKSILISMAHIMPVISLTFKCSILTIM